MPGPTKVLLVEDNPADSDLIAEAFDREKIAVNLSVVRDGEEAMDYLLRKKQFSKACRPDLILLDLNLPRKDGRELLSELKDHPKLKVIPVVVLTTSESEDDIMVTYQLHANGYITKPRSLKEYTRIAHGIDDFWFEIAKLPPRSANGINGTTDINGTTGSNGTTR